MVKNRTHKNILAPLLFAGLIIFSIFLSNVHYVFPLNDSFFTILQLTISTCIYIGLFSYWTISAYRRIMQRHVRNYFVLIGANIIFWITIRTTKWSAFQYVIFEDRFLWYLYYIPMLMLSILFIFISLNVGENEDYRASKKWNLLYIPAGIILIAILTNDFHLLAFDIDITKHAYGLDYKHGPIYYIALFFILSMVILSSYIIIRKFSISKNVRKKALLPALVILTTIIYSILYIITPVYGLGHIVDLTVFGCTMAIALLESFISAGLIHSNNGHIECFAMADIRAQILNNDGDVVYISENALPISKIQFEMLKECETSSLDSGAISHISPINGGYIVWNSDVTQIRDTIKKLKDLNKKLHKEVDILTFENDQKSERARLRKLNDLHNIMLKEILPLSEKIKSKIELSHRTQEDEIKQLLFETSMSSIYIKRKVNLTLTQQTEKCISVEEMRYCFIESFQLLRLYDITCAINIIESCDISLNAAMASLDLFQNIIESINYNFDTIYVTYNFDEHNMSFAVQVSGDINLCYDDISMDKNNIPKGEIQLLKETDSYYISLKMPKCNID